MIRSIILTAGLLTLASPAVAQSGQTYRALGTEPFWSVAVENGRMIYTDPEGRRIDVRAPAPSMTRFGRRYQSRRLTMIITPGHECSDGMSDRRYRDTVRVIVDGRRLDGCGGGIARRSPRRTG